jgi:hypothetical protein
MLYRYETSLDSFLGVFGTALDQAKRDASLDARLTNMVASVTRQVYDYTCTGIFERHKLMFSFQVTRETTCITNLTSQWPQHTVSLQHDMRIYTLTDYAHVSTVIDADMQLSEVKGHFHHCTYKTQLLATLTLRCALLLIATTAATTNPTQMACMVLDGEGSLQRSELDFFLKGDTSLAGPAKHCPPHAAHWLSAQGWKDMLCLSQLHPVFTALLQHFEAPSNAALWKCWYDLEAPEHAVLPGTDGASTSSASSSAASATSEVPTPVLTPLQKLCVMRCFRPDRVYNAAKGMVSSTVCITMLL